SFLASLEAEPGRLEELEAGLDRIAEAKRRFRVATYEELMERAAEAREELTALDGGADPAAAAAAAVDAAEARVHDLAIEARAERAQVITITHLPQIAAVADRHFRVEKIPGDPTHTRIDVLNEDERKAELDRMLGGQEFLATVRS